MSETEHWFQNLQLRLGHGAAEAIGCYVNAKIAENCTERHDTTYDDLCRSVCEHEERIKKVHEELTLAELGAEAIKAAQANDTRWLTELQERNDQQAKTIESYQAQRVNACAIIQEIHTIVHGGGSILRLANLTTSLKEVMGMIEDD